MRMANSDYWDESEFNFFSSLEDVDKLLYLYDLMIGEFAYEYEGNGSNYFEFELEDEMPEPKERIDVQMEFIREDEYDTIVLSGGSLYPLEKVASDLMMNGMVLMDRRVEFTNYDPWEVKLSYRLVGSGNPISLN